MAETSPADVLERRAGSGAWRAWRYAVIGAVVVALITGAIVALPAGRMYPIVLIAIIMAAPLLGLAVGLGAASAGVPLFYGLSRRGRSVGLTSAASLVASAIGALPGAFLIATILGWNYPLAMLGIATISAIGVLAACVRFVGYAKNEIRIDA